MKRIFSIEHWRTLFVIGATLIVVTFAESGAGRLKPALVVIGAGTPGIGAAAVYSLALPLGSGDKLDLAANFSSGGRRKIDFNPSRAGAARVRLRPQMRQL